MGFQAVCACQFLSKAEVPLDSTEVAAIALHFSLEASLQTVLVEQGWEHGFELQCQGQPKLGKQHGREAGAGQSQGEGLFNFGAKPRHGASAGIQEGHELPGLVWAWKEAAPAPSQAGPALPRTTVSPECLQHPVHQPQGSRGVCVSPCPLAL